MRAQIDEKLAEAASFQEKEDALKAQHEAAKQSHQDETRKIQEIATEMKQLAEQFAECLPGH